MNASKISRDGRENEDMDRLFLDNIDNLDKQPVQQPHEAVEELKNEITMLREELQRIKLIDSQRIIDASDHPHLRSNSIYSTKNPMESIIVDRNPSIQYVLNIDPLQQMKDFVKPFSGHPNEDANKWLDSVVHFIDIIQLPIEKEVLNLQYAPAFLKANAYRWWNENKHSISNWSIFTRMFLEQFGERNEYLLEQQLNQRKQLPNEPVLQYYYDMIDLCNKCDPSMSDKQKVRKLILGLRLSLYQEAIKENYLTPKQFLTRVEQLENIQKLVELRIDDSTAKQEFIAEPNSSSMNQSSNHIRYQNLSSPSSLPRSNNYPVSQNSGHYPNSRDSPRDSSSPSFKNHSQVVRPMTSSQRRSSSRVINFDCYECGKAGHFARDCPQRNRQSPFPINPHQQKNE